MYYFLMAVTSSWKMLFLKWFILDSLFSLCRFTYLFVFLKDRGQEGWERERKLESADLLPPWLSLARARPGSSQELGTSFGSLTVMVGTQVSRPCLAAFPGTLAGSWIWSRTTGLKTISHFECCCWKLWLIQLHMNFKITENHIETVPNFSFPA